ncbi:MAG: hypothetical protein QOJ39_947 [Candidatus Eremiobacteraeota bacterium]|jgi:hypothetical protein|nr:hypothetical protein [Candidatus Eremiobacteraeota bacterium]
MMRRVSAAACALVCAAVVFAPLSARADVSEANALSAGLLAPANASLQRALQDINANKKLEAAAKDVAQANPVGTPQAPIRRPSLPQGFTYNVDVSFAYPLSNVGFNAGDPGGMDAGFGYAFDRTHRITAGYYEIQQVPVGFSNKNVPFYLQGFTGPGSNVPGASLGTVNTGVVDATTKDKIFQVGVQNLFVIANKLPIVITPTYLAHTANIGGHSDEQLIEFNGFPTTVRLRTEQEWLLPVTLPFLSTPRMFGTFTAAPQWLVHRSGVNQTNHVQLFMLGYLEYRANKATTFFVQPSRLVQYNPVDPYPEYTPTLIYGLSHHFTPHTFVQMTVLEGGATNYNNQLGIVSLTCQRLPCHQNQVAPQFAGLKAAEVQIQFGIGSPTVIPL